MMPRSARGLLGYLGDRLYAWQNSLPPERCSYTVESTHVPIADNLKVTANLYLTLASPPLGTLLIRTPYGIGYADSVGTARFFAARGYHVLHSACRGTSGSDGDLHPGANEVADGHATVEWMRQQPWYTSSFATLGGSYLGYTQWALLTDPPKDMKAAAIFTGPHDWYDFNWGNGAMMSHMVIWADVTNRMIRNDGIISMLLFLRTITTRYKETFSSVPLLTAVEKYFSGAPPAWLRDLITSPERSAPYWQNLESSESRVLERTNIPVMLVTGWYDPVIYVVIDQYQALRQRGTPVRLVIGPWTHLGAQGRNIPAETLPLIDEHLASRPTSAQPAVRYSITGKTQEEWREIDHWPPPTSIHELFLDTEAHLSTTSPTSKDSSSTFTFDPTDPTPPIGATLAFARDPKTVNLNNDLISRPDVLTWTSPTLETGLEVCGKPAVELYHSTDTPHADILVILSEVDSAGVSRQLSERYLRLSPNPNLTEPRGSGSLELKLHDIAHVFRAGTKIRLSVAGGSHPRWIRNLGSGEDQATGTTLKSVKHTVRHCVEAVSKLKLPVIGVVPSS